MHGVVLFGEEDLYQLIIENLLVGNRSQELEKLGHLLLNPLYLDYLAFDILQILLLHISEANLATEVHPSSIIVI